MEQVSELLYDIQFAMQFEFNEEIMQQSASFSPSKLRGAGEHYRMSPIRGLNFHQAVPGYRKKLEPDNKTVLTPVCAVPAADTDMQLRISTIQKENDGYSAHLAFCEPFGGPRTLGPSVPVLLFRTGVLPQLRKGDVITVRSVLVAASCKVLGYEKKGRRRDPWDDFDDFEDFDEFEDKPLQFLQRAPKGRKNTAKRRCCCKIEGEIAEIKNFESFEFRHVRKDDGALFYIRTASGLLAVAVTDDMLNEEISRIGPGDRIQAEGWLVADCAYLEYAEGLSEEVKDLRQFILRSLPEVQHPFLEDVLRPEDLDAVRAAFAGEGKLSASAVRIIGRKDGAPLCASEEAVAATAADGALRFFILFDARCAPPCVLRIERETDQYLWTPQEEPIPSGGALSGSKKSMNSDYINYRGYKEKLPKVTKHYEGPDELLALLFNNKKLRMTGLREHRRQTENVYVCRIGDGYRENPSLQKVPRLTTYGSMCSAVPVFPGNPVFVRFRSSFPWSSREYQPPYGEFTFVPEESGAVLSAFCPYFSLFRSELKAGDTAVASLSAFSAVPALQREAGDEPLPEDKFVLQPSSVSSTYRFRTVIRSAEQLPFYGTVLYRCSVELYADRISKRAGKKLLDTLYLRLPPDAKSRPEEGMEVSGLLTLFTNTMQPIPFGRR
jgi:hypothetical protein